MNDEEQLSLDGEAEAVVRRQARLAALEPGPGRNACERETIEARFRRFDRDFPEVYEHFKRLAWRLRRAGQTRIGGRMIWEVMRYRYLLAGVQDDRGFKLNDHFPPHYVRKLIDEDPSFEEFFELRQLRAA